VPAKASRGSTAGSRQAREPGEQHVDLELGALGRGLGSGLAEQPRQHRRRDVGEDVARPGAPAVPADLGASSVGGDPRDLDAAAQLGAGPPGGAGQSRGERAHAAHGHVPVARAVADGVVEEAAVLAQPGVGRLGEGADQAVGEDDPPLEVVVEAVGQRLTQGALDERLPRGVIGDERAQLVARAQRLGERREDARRDAAGEGREVAPGGARRLTGAHQQPAAVRAGGVGGDRAAPQLDADPELGRDPARQQRDEVRVARDAGVDPVPGALGDGRPADALAALQHEHRAPGAREVGGGDEPVVAAPHDHDVVAHLSPRPRLGAARGPRRGGG
jgi:hypothetical protein